jgi:alpha-N-arabinofuranosidase
VLGGLTNIAYGDDRFINNIFVGGDAAIPERNDPKAQKNVGYGLEMYTKAKRPVWAEGSVYFKNAGTCVQETNSLDQAAFDPEIKLVEEDEGVYLEMTLPPSLRNAQRSFVTTKSLGNAIVTGLPYENVDGTPLQIDRDFLGKERNPANPFVGPFEDPGEGRVKIKVW